MVKKKLGEEKLPLGRKQIAIDWNEVDRLMIAGCTGIQIAASLGICEDTLYNRCKADKKKDFSAYLAEKRQKGDSNLLSKQYDVAIDGNTTMLVWLGKQRLKQREKFDDENGNVVQTFTELKKMIADGSLLKMLMQNQDKEETGKDE
ncbi:MAG: hypothetical protein WC679_13415 [Bacteroidales bacterium]|jgi:hypothetical protein